jgi:hypothetical protein
MGAGDHTKALVRAAEVPCGDEIDSLIYALDVFLPLVDLRQEARCAPSSDAWAAPWVWAKALYALLGWIVTSLAILTVSGIMKRRTGS